MTSRGDKNMVGFDDKYLETKVLNRKILKDALIFNQPHCFST